MITLGDVWVILRGDPRPLDEEFDNTERKSSSLASKLGGVLKVGIAGAMGAVVGLGAALASSIGPASDLNETVSKVGVVFGSSASQVLAFGDTAASALGMTRNEALAAAGTYGNLFRSMGMVEETSADMSVGLVELAGDLASFNNMDPTLVLDKLRAGLSGETEPLKALGVNLTAAAIKAKAMAMGLSDGTGELTASAKAQASYALIMEQTSLAQGDFARTSTGLANQQRILKATFGDMKATIGTAILPAVNSLAGAFTKLMQSERVQAVIAAITTKLGELAAIVGTVITQFVSGDIQGGLTTLFGPAVADGIMGIVDVLGQVVAFVQANLVPVLSALGAIILAIVVPAFVAWAAGAWAAAAPMLPLIAILAAIGAAVGLLVAAWRNDWGGIRTTLTAVWEGTLQPALNQIKTWLQVNIPVALATLKSIWDSVTTGAAEIWNTVLLPAINAVWGFIQNSVIPLFMALADVAGAVLGVAITALAGLWQNVLQPALTAAWDWLGKVVSVVADALSPALDTLGGWFTTISGLVTNTVLPALTTLKENILDKLAGVFSGIGNAIAGVVDWFGRVADAIRNIHLPAWLTPGSPTPFELGLRGITTALYDLGRVALPKLDSTVAQLVTMTVKLSDKEIGKPLEALATQVAKTVGDIGKPMEALADQVVKTVGDIGKPMEALADLIVEGKGGTGKPLESLAEMSANPTEPNVAKEAPTPRPDFDSQVGSDKATPSVQTLRVILSIPSLNAEKIISVVLDRIEEQVVEWGVAASGAGV